MSRITGTWVSHEVAKGWRVRVEVLCAAPLDSQLWLEHDGTAYRVEGRGKSPVCSGKAGWPAGMPVAAQRTMAMILDSQEYGARGEEETVYACEYCHKVCKCVHEHPTGNAVRMCVQCFGADESHSVRCPHCEVSCSAGPTINQLMDAVLNTSDMTDDECKAELAASGVDVQAASRRFDERFAALAKRGKV